MAIKGNFNPGVAAVLSLIFPGAGQIYKGQVLNGIFWCVFVLIGYILLVVPGVILHISCIYGAYSGGVKQKECPFCGEPIIVSAIKCKHCGSSLTKEVLPNA